MFENYDLIKSFIYSNKFKRRQIIKKIMILNKKKEIPLYAYNIDFFFETLKRGRNKFTKKIKFFDFIIKLFYVLFCFIFIKKKKKFKYFLYYSVANELFNNNLTNIYKEGLLKIINEKDIEINYFIPRKVDYLFKFSKGFPVNFNYNLLKLISIYKYIQIKKKYKNIYTKNLILNTIYQNEIFLFWKNFLKNKKPKVVFLIDKMTNYALLKACYELKIPSCEIQHGSPLVLKDQKHYNLKINGKFINNQSWFSKIKPKFFICHGKFWKLSIDRSGYSKRIIDIGLNLNHLTKHNSLNNEVLILSELTDFEQIKNLISKIKKSKFNKYKCKIRFHPFINNLPKNIYNYLKSNNINFSFARSYSIIKDLKNTDKIVGENSTLLFYLYERGYKTYFLDSKIFPKKYLAKDKKFFNLPFIKRKYQNHFISKPKKNFNLNFIT